MPLALPTGQRGRLLALGITVALLIVVWFAAISPLIDLYADRAQQLDERRGIAAHMAFVAAQLPELTQRASAANRNGPPPTLLLQGSSDAVAGAALQNLVQDMAKGGANLVSVESLPAEPAGAYRRIGIKISFNAPWPILVGLLQSIEQASPPMLIDDLQIHGSPLSLINRTTGLEAGLTIYSFRAAAESKP